MSVIIPFASNYSDVSTNEGYQFEFRCLRCGNGFRSQFRHSVTGFGGRIATIVGSLVGGTAGSRIEEVGYMAGWNRSSTRGSTNDKRLLEASEDVADQFAQCRTCRAWICRPVCWNPAAGCCVDCVAYSAGMPAGAPERCGRCGAMGHGRFCGQCGGPMAASCRACGTPLRGTPFCAQCGTPAG